MKDVEQTLDEAYKQIKDDRKLIMESYEKFSAEVTRLDHYVMAGAHLNKCLELLSKQTGQLLELAKMQQGSDKKRGTKSLSEDEEREIYSSIQTNMH